MSKEKFIKTWKRYKNCNEDVIEFIANILYHGNEEDNSIYNLFANGYCYYFAMMLKTAFNRGTICWHRGHGHIVWVDDNDVAYDIGGIFEDYKDGDLLPVELLSDMIIDFMHNGKEYKVGSPQFHDWAKRNNMSDSAAIASVYMSIPKQDLDDSKTVEENAMLYWHKKGEPIDIKSCKVNCSIKSNERYREYDNSKNITIGDYVKLYGMNDKTKIRIVDESEEELFNDRIDYLQYTSEGCMHDLCSLKIKCFLDENEIEVYSENYNGRKGVY